MALVVTWVFALLDYAATWLLFRRQHSAVLWPIVGNSGPASCWTELEVAAAGGLAMLFAQ